MKKIYNRRRFLKYSLATAVGISPLMNILGPLNSLQAAEVDGDYKAIVCVLLEGGADVFNMIAPREQSAYDKYNSCRPNIALARDSLLPITHTNSNGLNPLPYGMRDNMTAMQRLFNDKKLTIVANVGTLVRPVTTREAEYGIDVPFELFAHNTQRAQWMFGDASGLKSNGWAARVADLFYPGPNSSPYFNVNVADVNNILQSGGNAEAIHFKRAGISPNTMRRYGFGPESGGGELGNVYQDLYEAGRNNSNKLMAAFAKKRVEDLNRPDELAGLFDNVRQFEGFGNGVHESGKSLGKQLKLVAQILSVKNAFPGGRKRQIFFVNYHGWDTHNSDNEHEVGYLSESLGAFQNALQSMGLEQNVTTITISDFGRSLTSNNAGTDHGWGTHAFVMGGAIKGGDIYGKMPVLEPNSPDAVSDRMVPTTAVEEYIATVVKWFGAAENELENLFPYLRNYGVKDMGFMKF